MRHLYSYALQLTTRSLPTFLLIKLLTVALSYTSLLPIKLLTAALTYTSL
jgi:hypothetical protein